VTVRGALIGCGFFAENHLNAWSDLGVEIVAVCDLNSEKAKQAAARHRVRNAYSDAEEMLRTERPDFVDIATTVKTHRPLVELAARYRTPVICQKPFAESMDDAEAMVAVCAAAGVPLMVHENFRWQRPMCAVRQQIDSGSIGKPFFGRISFRHDYDVYAVQPYLAQVERFAILDVGIHLLDLARYYFGEVTRISCTCQRVNPKVRGEDVATMLLSHASGATSVVDASFSSKIRPSPFPQTLLEIDGSSGSLRVGEGYRMTTVGEERTETSVEPTLMSWMERPYHGVQESVVNIQRHWLECLKSGAEPATSGRDNLLTLRLGFLAYDAAETGRTLSVEP